MDTNDFRAKQFLPFDALKGFYEEVEKENKIKTEKKELSHDIFENLNHKILKIKKSDKVTIKYYDNFDYIETTGIIKKIDKVYKRIFISNSIIDIDDIIEIKILNF